MELEGPPSLSAESQVTDVRVVTVEFLIKWRVLNDARKLKYRYSETGQAPAETWSPKLTLFSEYTVH
jgi:hypothetical protein